MFAVIDTHLGWCLAAKRHAENDAFLEQFSTDKISYFVRDRRYLTGYIRPRMDTPYGFEINSLRNLSFSPCLLWDYTTPIGFVQSHLLAMLNVRLEFYLHQDDESAERKAPAHHHDSDALNPVAHSRDQKCSGAASSSRRKNTPSDYVRPPILPLIGQVKDTIVAYARNKARWSKVQPPFSESALFGDGSLPSQLTLRAPIDAPQLQVVRMSVKQLIGLRTYPTRTRSEAKRRVYGGIE
ncbi:hypothetical protein BDZ89DRAFT_1036905 [Hymenopellis radicata]|nr:hypothetical protein BDZ89DRAFT_1036905 [Hymenopellis radicata]